MNCTVYYREGKQLHSMAVGGPEDVSEAFLEVEAYLYNSMEKWDKPMLAVIKGGL
jgi:hypothetical protein